MTTVAGVPAEYLAPLRNDPLWQGFEAVAHTLPYDAAIMANTMSGQPLPTRRWTNVTMPTLILDGDASPAYMHNSAQALAALLPNAQRRTLANQSHAVDADVLAPILAEFFAKPV
jgi:pimeloyl-ACP methyl ester carboxylesterase